MTTLFTPLRFLRIRFRGWVAYTIVVPLVGSLSLTWLLLGTGVNVPIFGKDHFLDQLQSLLVILGGFFIAALTLVTSDSNPLLSEQVAGRDPPTLLGEDAPLTRRRWLGYLFGYLAFASFVMAGAFTVANVGAVSLRNSLSPAAALNAKFVFVFLTDFWLCHVFVSSLIGLMYFTDRLQRDEPRIVGNERFSDSQRVAAE